MAGFIKDIIWNSVEGFVEAGTRSAGGFAGDALIKAGDMIENGGRGVGNGIERKATSYGSSISGQTYQPSPKALPSTARKPAVKRSHSTPASSKPAASKTPSKYPGKNQVGGTTGAAKKAVTGGVGAAQRTIPPFKGPTSTPASKTLPKPYPNSNNLPKPYGGNSFPSSGSKTAVKPGQPKPFVPPVSKKVDEKKPYPGTNTLPGQSSKTPVKPVKAKPPPRLGPQIGEGQKMQHIAV
ncbi:hypothetical protein BKA66DRAFT_568567 [Pyrenochaeta sp. MPI-SDFR-AT-0127]|nr:hypothetical protein BKA66DRAFT_568567 [Pyrenochaeta sp. MPI-SDFR-AT-0127]